MSVRPRRSIAAKARLYFGGAVAVALAVTFGAFAIGWAQYSIQQRADELSRQVAAVAGGMTASDAATASTQDRLMRVEAGLMGAQLFVTDTGGGVLRSTVATPPATLPLDRLATAASGDGARSGVLRTAAGVQVLVVAAPIDADSQLVAIQSLAEIRTAQAGIILIAAIALLLAVIASYFIGGILARRLTAPLIRLESATELVAAGALGTQVAEEGDRETASLARSFNRMTRRVAATHEAQKAFVADVSHEIRTPLTSIRGYAEAMLDGTVADEDARLRALGVIRDEAVRIGEVSQALLALSELEAGSITLACVPVDPALLADALGGRFAAAATAAHVSLELAIPALPRPLGDSERLLQAASTLVDNAIAHTPEGGTVLVSAQTEAEEWRLAVEDSGPGIPVDRRDAIFGRFARFGAPAGAGGAGLGLAICRRLIELMGGTVGVNDSTLGGARFEIALSIAEE